MHSRFYVTRIGSAHIDEYNNITLQLTRRLFVSSFGLSPWGLAACEAEYVLYMSDYMNNAVHRLDMSETDNTANPTVTQWSVASGPIGLSINAEHV